MVFTAVFPKPSIAATGLDLIKSHSYPSSSSIFDPPELADDNDSREAHDAHDSRTDTQLKWDLKSVFSESEKKLNLWNFIFIFVLQFFFFAEWMWMLVKSHKCFLMTASFVTGKIYDDIPSRAMIGEWISQPLRSPDPGAPGDRTWMRTPIHCCHWQICRRTIDDGMGISWGFMDFPSDHG